MENIYQKAAAFDKNKNKTYYEWIRWVGVEDDLESACNPFSGVKGAVMVLFFVGLLTAAFFFVLRALFGEIEFWVALVAAAVVYWGAVIPLLLVVKNKTDGYYKQLLEIEKEGNKILFDYLMNMQASSAEVKCDFEENKNRNREADILQIIDI